MLPTGFSVCQPLDAKRQKCDSRCRYAGKSPTCSGLCLTQLAEHSGGMVDRLPVASKVQLEQVFQITFSLLFLVLELTMLLSRVMPSRGHQMASSLRPRHVWLAAWLFFYRPPTTTCVALV